MKKSLLLAIFSVSAFAYVQCTMCHNGGYQVNLKQYTPKQIEKIMMEYKNGKKIGNMMPDIARKMTKEEIEEAANKYGKK